MAHSNPEFALGRRAMADTDDDDQRVTVASLRRRVAAIATISPDDRTPEEARVFALWRASVRHTAEDMDRDLTCSFAPEPNRDFGAGAENRRGERWVPPRPRLGPIKFNCAPVYVPKRVPLR